MFVPQAGKTVFNQSTLILIIRVSLAVWCPHFETEETKNKHSASGKENTDKFTPLCLFACDCSLSRPLQPTHLCQQKHTTHPHTHVQVTYYLNDFPLL